MEGYLRPETLFGTKFENYLNAPARRNNGNGTPGRQQGNVYTMSNGTTTNNPFLADLDKASGDDDLPFTF